VLSRRDLGSWNLNVGSDIRVTALFIRRIHRCGGIAVCGAVNYRSVRIRRARNQVGSVDLRVRTAGTRTIGSPINVVPRNVRRSAGIPRQVDRVGWRRRASTGCGIGARGWLGAAGKCQGGAGPARNLRAESHGKSCTLTRRNRNRKRQPSHGETRVVAAGRRNRHTRSTGVKAS